MMQQPSSVFELDDNNINLRRVRSTPSEIGNRASTSPRRARAASPGQAGPPLASSAFYAHAHRYPDNVVRAQSGRLSVDEQKMLVAPSCAHTGIPRHRRPIHHLSPRPPLVQGLQMVPARYANLTARYVLRSRPQRHSRRCREWMPLSRCARI